MEEKKKFNINPLQGKNDDKGGKPKFNVYWIYGILAVSFILINIIFSGSDSSKIDWLKFEKMVKDQDVEKVVVINKDAAQVYITPESWNSGKYDDLKSKGINSWTSTGPQCYFNIGSTETFETKLRDIEQQFNYSDEQRIPISYETKKDIFGEMLGWLLPLVILVAVWLFIFRRMGGGSGGGVGGNIFNVGKSKAKVFDKDATSVKVDFKDVAGLQEAKVEIKEIVDFLKNPKKYTDLGGKIPKGALLVGPPGTGKTLLAKAVAGEANVPFFSMSGSDFVEMFVGVGASRVRDLFKQAKEKAPCIVFIDEIDAVGRARGRNPNFGANDERENTLNQLLTEMDGFASNAGVIILAATNRADVLDRALLRAGRFDRQIHVELPDLNERKEIFKVHLAPIKVEKSLNVDFLAKQTPGFSGADIANVCNEAALVAARKNKKKVTKQDFLDAVDRIVGGLEKKNKIITPGEKKTIAFHEAGHASVSWLLEHANPLVKVTIVPRGKSLGAAWYLPEERQITTTEQLLDEMCSALGGRASEEIFFNKISTGALNDLEKVTKQAYAMISFFGMSKKVGNLSFYDSTGQGEYSFNKPYSEKTAELIDLEVKALVDIEYERAKEIILNNKEKLEELAQMLLDKEVIFSEDLERIFGKRINHSRLEALKDQKPETKSKKEVKGKEASKDSKEQETESDKDPQATKE
ncbi:MAG: ATP-dependent zinc metalloprotease FtsH [Bacteroidales bacterium]|nr:ATP-dependent zinc metalloprotease FtsH [Bacteroidales bacterium]